MALTQNDFSKLRKIFATKFDLKDLEKNLKEQINGLPTKKEFYDKMDKLMAELIKGREEIELLPSKVSDHEERITKIEDIHPNYQHAS